MHPSPEIRLDKSEKNHFESLTGTFSAELQGFLGRVTELWETRHDPAIRRNVAVVFGDSRRDHGSGRRGFEQQGKGDSMAEKSELYFEDGTIIASTRYAAAYFGVTPATLSNWGKSGCPHFKYGFWDIKAVTAWCTEKDGERLAEAARTDPSKMTPAQLKTHYEALLKQEQLEGARLRNQIANGEFLRRGDVVRELSQFFAVFRASSFGLGEALAQLVSDHTDSETGRTAAGLIRSRITQALSQMAVSGVWAPEEEGA